MVGVQRGLSHASTSQSWNIKCLHMGKCRPPPGMKHRRYANSYAHTKRSQQWNMVDTQTGMATPPCGGTGTQPTLKLTWLHCHELCKQVNLCYNEIALRHLKKNRCVIW